MSEKVALVTGAAGGIGTALVQAFAKSGVRVLALDYDENALEKLVTDLNAFSDKVHPYVCDVANSKSVSEAIGSAAKIFGRLDIAVNNAGIEMEADPIAKTEEHVFDRLIEVNLKGVFLCLKHQISQMLQQGDGGSIVNVASVAGLIGAASQPAYTASKHGVVGLTKAAALGYAANKIRVNAVCPGAVQTAMTDRAIAAEPKRRSRIARIHPLGRMATPLEVASACLWLCSDAASFVTGHALPVDGGMTAY